MGQAMNRKLAATWFLALLAALMLLEAMPGMVHAQAYPTKPLRLIVGFAPGGPADVIARVLAPRLTAHLGQPVMVDNRPGADANIAMATVAKSAPDGYTLYLTLVAVAINPALYKSVPFDPIKDFAPITLIGHMPNLVTIHPSVPATSLRQLIEFARAHKAQLFYGATASNITLATEMLNRMASIQTIRVNFKGAGPAIIALVTGEVQILISGIGTLLPHAKSGRVRALAITSAGRSPLAPEIPTVDEAGVPGYVATTWYGIAAPGATPRSVIDRVNADMRKVMAEPEAKARLLDFIIEPTPTTPEQFAAFIQSEIVKWDKVVKDSGITIE
jgi:tripartite-type tricarboxylate transporter receptor subunit TctC